MKKGKFSLLVLLIMSLCWTGVQAAWDLDLDFENAATNPYGTWSYGWIDGSGFHLFTDMVTDPDHGSNIRAWRYPGNWDNKGNIQKILEGQPDFEAWTSYRYGGELCSGPGGDGGVRTTVRWTCPESGTFMVTATWQGLSLKSGGTTVDVTLEKNGTSIYNDNVAGFIGRPGEAPSGSKPQVTFFNIMELQAGETLDMTFAGGADGIAADCTNMDFNISPAVYPPASMNLVMKLDAGVGVKDPNKPGGITYGDTVVVWEDQGASGLLDVTTEWGTPTLQQGTFPNGSYNVIRFTGADGMTLQDPNVQGALNLTTYTIYVVGKLNQAMNTNQVFFGNYNASNGYALGISGTVPDYVKFWTNAGGEMRSGGPLEADRYYLLAASVDNTFTKRMIINDCVEDEGMALSTYADATVVSVGALGGGSQFLKGDIAEIRVYDGFISANHSAIVNELVNKYGLDRECLGGPNPDQVALTALTFFGTSASGTVRPEERWNTLYPDAAWDVVLTDRTIDELQAIVLDPNDPFPAALNIVDNLRIYENLTKGQEYTYTWINARAGAAGLYFGMNFFFDSAQDLGKPHGISVFANMTDPGESPEPFQANSSTTMGWPISDVPGAGTLIYKDFDKGLAVTLTDWVAYNPDVYGLDLVTAQSTGHPITGGADGLTDLIGQFTLRVDPYEMTCADQDEYFAMDFDKDCYVDLADFAKFIESWLDCTDPQNEDCSVNP